MTIVHRCLALVVLYGSAMSTAFAEGRNASGNSPTIPPSSTFRANPAPGPIERTCRNCRGGERATHWQLAGSAPEDYRLGYKMIGTTSNKVNVYLVSKPGANAKGFGTIMQTIAADDYRGRRVRFSALLQSRDVADGAGLWLRVDGANDAVLVLDDMQSRPVLGTQNWRRYEVVVDVPESGETIAYGVLLIGAGTLGFDEIRFDQVDNTTPTTNPPLPPKAPVNLELKQ